MFYIKQTPSKYYQIYNIKLTFPVLHSLLHFTPTVSGVGKEIHSKKLWKSVLTGQRKAKDGKNWTETLSSNW